MKLTLLFLFVLCFESLNSIDQEYRIYLKIRRKDKIFRTTCKKLGWLKPENLHIPKEVFSMPLFKKAEYHIKKMDHLRTPGGMLDQFGLGVQLINSMFVFMMNEKHAEAGDLLPIIIYSIINW